MILKKLNKRILVKTITGSIGVVSLFASSSAFANLSCDIGKSDFYSSSVVIKDVVISNTGANVANNIKIALTFDNKVGFDKTWGDVAKSASTSGNTITFSAKSALKAGNSIDFGFKGRNTGSASSVSCSIVNQNAVSSAPSRPAALQAPANRVPATPSPVAPQTPSRPAPQRPNSSGSAASSDKCPTSNTGALLVQNFESFPLGKPAFEDRKQFQKEFCTALHTMAGFGAKDESSPTISNADQKRQAIGRERAGQNAQAQDYVRLEIVEGEQSFDGKSLKVLFPNGGNTSSHSGVQYPEYIPTTIRYDRETDSYIGQNRFQEMYVSYWVKFEDDFSWQLGGKLPGIIAERGFKDENKEARKDRTNTRLMWREQGKLEFYIHSPYLKDKTAGKAYEDRIFWDNGSDFKGHAKLTKGKWHHIEYRMKLNDVIDGKVYANGELEGWLDGKQAAYYNDVTLRGDADVNINTFFFSTFFGGSSGHGQNVWWPLKDVYAYFDQIEVSDKRIGCCSRP